ncbi:hypothetical protein VV11_010015 [Trichodesmium erythraeum 21-75]|nr:hypothetical protein [Trichodesmium erythraeum 21-75]
MENKETLSRTLNNSKSQLKWLEIAEYSALGTSILTLFFEQILFAATSIILALFLNIINRKNI